MGPNGEQRTHPIWFRNSGLYDFCATVSHAESFPCNTPQGAARCPRIDVKGRKHKVRYRVQACAGGMLVLDVVNEVPIKMGPNVKHGTWKGAQIYTVMGWT